MYNGQKIKDLLRERKIANKELIKYMGWRGNGQLAHVSNVETANPTARVLEQLADFFKVPIDDFFTRSIAVKSSKVAPSLQALVDSMSGEIESLKILIAEKDKRLALQQQMIDILSKK